MEELEIVVPSPEQWREKNRGLLIALSACLMVWAVAIWLVVRT